MAEVRPEDQLPRTRSRLLALTGISFLVLVVQNALGIYVNLFVTLALPSSQATVIPVVLSNAVLAAHGLVAFVLIALAVTMLVYGGRVGDGTVRALTIGGVIVLAVTAYLGYHFVASQENFYSFGMEMGFLAMLLIDAAILTRLRGDRVGPDGTVAGAAAGS